MPVYNNNDIDHTKQPLFFGESMGLQRFDTFAYPIFDKLTQKQLGNFWRPEEVSLQKDRADFNKLNEGQKFIFTENISYQIRSDSTQGRGPVLALLPHVSVPELEACIITWDFFETIHSRSYTHILKNVYPDPSEVFDNINSNSFINARSNSLDLAYDELLDVASHKRKNDDKYESLYKTMMAINILEGLKFYNSFAVTFAFGEMRIMEGSAKIIKFIARDEAQHYAITQHIFKIWEKDPKMSEIMKSMKDETAKMFEQALSEEVDWNQHLFRNASMMGLSAPLLNDYDKWLCNKRMKNINLDHQIPDAPKSNPLPWTESWLSNKGVQVAPQETEIVSYVVGGVKNDVDDDLLGSMTL